MRLRLALAQKIKLKMDKKTQKTVKLSIMTTIIYKNGKIKGNAKLQIESRCQVL